MRRGKGRAFKTDEEEELLVKEYVKQGYNQYELARMYDVHARTIERYLRKNGVEIRSTRSKKYEHPHSFYFPKQLLDLIDVYCDDFSTSYSQFMRDAITGAPSVQTLLDYDDWFVDGPMADKQLSVRLTDEQEERFQRYADQIYYETANDLFDSGTKGISRTMHRMSDYYLHTAGY